MIRILVVEDDASQRKALLAFLGMHHYALYEAPDGAAALDLLAQVKIDLVLCDVMMPRMDGFELTKALREYDPHLPILILTAKGEANDKQTGFRAGTDDYMVKPVDFGELLLRMEALLRRANLHTEHRIRVGRVLLDELEATLQVGDALIQVPKKEFELLFVLLSYPGKLLTRRQLMDAVWGPECDSDERTIDVHIKRLREKTDGLADFRIATVRGLGYRAEVAHA